MYGVHFRVSTVLKLWTAFLVYCTLYTVVRPYCTVCNCTVRTVLCCCIQYDKRVPSYTRNSMPASYASDWLDLIQTYYTHQISHTEWVVVSYRQTSKSTIYCTVHWVQYILTSISYVLYTYILTSISYISHLLCWPLDQCEMSKKCKHVKVWKSYWRVNFRLP